MREEVGAESTGRLMRTKNEEVTKKKGRLSENSENVLEGTSDVYREIWLWNIAMRREIAVE